MILDNKLSLILKYSIISCLGKFTFEKFDWKNYRWNTDATKSMVKKTGSAVSALKSLSKPKKKSTKGMTKKEKKEYDKKYIRDSRV